MIRPLQRAIRIGATPPAESPEVANLRTRVDELDAANEHLRGVVDRLRMEKETLRAINERYAVDNARLRAQRGPILIGAADAVRMRETLTRYEDMLAQCRDHHGGNRRGGVLAEPTVAEILAEKRRSDL